MSWSTDPVELLERAIGYTRGTLAGVTDVLFSAATPCAEWDLSDLLAHMVDGLDAFTEASRGHIDVAAAKPSASPVANPGDSPVDVLRDKACALLGAWTSPAARSAQLGAVAIDCDLLLQIGALEITVHGWDVAQATGARTPIPAALASDLMPVARGVVTEADRGIRFAPVGDTSPAGDPGEILLAHLGRV